jgi:hypothetical protein
MSALPNGPFFFKITILTAPVAEYAEKLLIELRGLASGAGLTFLAYLIQVAVEEARIQAEEHKDDA